MEDSKYVLINSIVAHDGPVRSICAGLADGEIITGCQSDAPNIRRWRLSSDFQSVEEIGAPLFHDHWVTALTSRSTTSARFPKVCSLVIQIAVESH